MRISRAELLEQKRAEGKLPAEYLNGAGAAEPARSAPTTSGRVTAGHMRAPRALEGAPRKPLEVDSGGLGGRVEDQLRVLAARVNSIAGGATSDAEAAVAALSSRLASLGQEVKALQSGLTELESALAVARARMDAANAAAVQIAPVADMVAEAIAIEAATAEAVEIEKTADGSTQGTLNLE